MKKSKLLTLLLTLCLILASISGGQAFAAPRETNVFNDIEHSTISYEDIEYKRYDPTEFYKLCDAIISLTRNAEYEQRVLELYHSLIKEMNWISTMYTVINNKTHVNVNDEEAAAELQYTYSVILRMNDRFYSAMKRVVNSPCKTVIEKEIPSEILGQIQLFEEMTQEQEALSNQERELVNEYMQKSNEQYTTKVGGKKMTLSDLDTAYLSGTIDFDTYNAAQTKIVQKMNEVLGEIYLRMVKVRNQIAASYGYQNYGDYAYEIIYDRDYSQKEIKNFHKAVKQWVLEPSAYVSLFIQMDPNRAFYSADYTPNKVIPLLRKYMPEISSEIAESFQYMLDYNMHNLAYDENKMGAAYTTYLISYAAPYMFLKPNETIYDFTTVIHESGHYNAFYWTEPNWWMSNNIDLAEVHSQGLELLFFKFYDEIFGFDSEAVQEYMIGSMMNSIIQGCMYDEFQQIVYANPDYTLEQFNEAYMRILKEYGYADADDPRTQAYGWVSIPHTFTSPMYYISYAVSASAALQIWQKSLENYNGAVDQYLEIVHESGGGEFVDTLIGAGLENPLTAEYLKKLNQNLFKQLNINERYEALVNEMTGTENTGK